MSDNLRHWSALGKTDPKHTKPFQRAGGFRGTATKPIWTEYRLTEHFGPCGEGWGCEQPTFTLVNAADEILVYCSLQCWYLDGGQPRFIWGIGGDKVLVKQQSGLRADDEAYKKAFTDALGNAFKHVGAGADVHMGLFEDSKYVAAVGREFADEAAAPPAGERNAAPPQRPPTTGMAPPAPRPVPATRADEPPEVMQARTAARTAFWRRDSYEVNPEVVEGGMAGWDREMLTLAEAAPTLDAYLKLRDENKPHFIKWRSGVAVAVVESFNERLGVVYRRLSPPDEERAA